MTGGSPAPAPLFGSMLMGGFECAAQRLRNGRRLDLTRSTGHDRRAAEDYALLRAHGLGAARDGLNWVRIERWPGRYDWSSVLPMLHAARDSGMPVVWDLLHYGVPNDIDVFAPAFVDRFAAFAEAAGRLFAAECDGPQVFTPVNEISFWAFAGGETGGLNPFARGRGDALKRQLVRAFLAAGAALKGLDARTRIATAEPLIHVHAITADAHGRVAAYNEAQFEALDMLLGRTAPELGGHAAAVDIAGFNYYYNNQWVDNGPAIHLGHWLHRPLSELLGDVARRYPALPRYIAETGTEGIFRPYWLRYVADEVREAAAAGAPVGGICLYPIISHLGWDDDRHCANGLWDGHDADGPRTAYAPLAAEIRRQAAAFTANAMPAAHDAGQDHA